MTKDEAIKKVIEIAKKEVGYKEGKGNITKYAKYFDDLRKKGINVYNYPKQGAEWCDIFVDYCFYQAFGESGMKMLYQPMKDCGAGCKYSAEYFRKKKAFFTSPEIGDQIFFGKKGAESHTGLVVKVTDKMVYTIEGNKDNQVKECSYKRDIAKIVGYGRPDWKLVIGSSGASEKKEEDKKKEEKPKSPEIVKYKVIAEHGLNIRKGPSTDYPRIATMPKGSVFEVQKIVGEWAFGKYGKVSGYSCMKWLKK